MPIDCTREQKDILDSTERTLLVSARPGRGKTTVALLLAERIVRDRQITPSQKVLFLTFSRNAVCQIRQAGGRVLDSAIRRQLWIATYHSFMWWLLETLGRFHGLPCTLDVMGKTQTRAARIAAERVGVRAEDVPFYLAKEVAAISYDDFAPLALDILRSSTSVCREIRQRFPVVVVDEFQDTNAEQWDLIRTVSQDSRLVCLADPDQMIFRWRGASADRLSQLRTARETRLYQLQSKCLRTDDSHLLEFAEAILDNKPGSQDDRVARRRRFLAKYPGPNALGYYLKVVVRGFQSDFRKRSGPQRFPCIAIAAYSNATARYIQQALGKPTKKAPKVYRCSLLEGQVDDALERLLIHLAAWAAAGERRDLESGIQLMGGMLVSDISKASGALASLFAPRDLLEERARPRGTAKHIVEQFRMIHPGAAGTGREAILLAAESVKKVAESVSAISKVVSLEDLEACERRMLNGLAGVPGEPAASAVQRLREKLRAEKLRVDVQEWVAPPRGIASSTLHRLKGREFDYVCVVTRAAETLHGRDGDEADARRLMYVALTRARYDAKVLYVGSDPCFLLRPYLSA